MDASTLLEHLPTFGLAIAPRRLRRLPGPAAPPRGGGGPRGLADPAPASVPASNKALAIFAVAAVLEIVGDRSPGRPRADVIGTRPACGGALLAASVLDRPGPGHRSRPRRPSVRPPPSCSRREGAALRTASTVFTGGLANSIISVLEDVITVAPSPSPFSSLSHVLLIVLAGAGRRADRPSPTSVRPA
jgi:hypothetical protein